MDVVAMIPSTTFSTLSRRRFHGPGIHAITGDGLRLTELRFLTAMRREGARGSVRRLT
jgi:hypothetical protein